MNKVQSILIVIDELIELFHPMIKVVFNLFIITSIMVILNEFGEGFNLTSRLIILGASLTWCYPDFKKIVKTYINIFKDIGETK